jgi:hypothetical protein
MTYTTRAQYQTAILVTAIFGILAGFGHGWGAILVTLGLIALVALPRLTGRGGLLAVVRQCVRAVGSWAVGLLITLEIIGLVLAVMGRVPFEFVFRGAAFAAYVVFLTTLAAADGPRTSD